MAYELRRIENEAHKCPKCFGRTVKGGKNSQGRPKRICQECGFQFVATKKGQSIEELEEKIKSNHEAIKRLKELAV